MDVHSEPGGDDVAIPFKPAYAGSEAETGDTLDTGNASTTPHPVDELRALRVPAETPSVAATSVPDEEPAARASQELVALDTFARTLQRLSQEGAPADVGSSFDHLERSAEFLRLVTDMCVSLNETGDATRPERQPDIAPGIVELHLAGIVQKKNGGVELTAAEARLLRTYADTHEGKLRCPSWYAPFRDILTLTMRSDRLPGPDAYLECSPSMSTRTRSDCTKLRTLSDDLLRSRQSKDPLEGPNGPKTEELRDQITALTEKLDKILFAAKDVDPLKVSECLGGAHIRVTPRMNLVSGIAKACATAGTALESSLGVHTANAPEVVILPYPVSETSPSGKASTSVAQHEISVSRFQNDADAHAVLRLLRSFLTLRKSTEDTHHMVSDTPPRLEGEERDARSALRSTMGSLFPGGGSATRQALLSLEAQTSEEIKALLPSLLTCRILGGTARSGDTLSFTFQSPSNISILGITLRHLIRGSDASYRDLKATLEASGSRTLLQTVDPVRKLLIAKDISGLVQFFDRNLETLRTKQHVQPEERASLLQALAVVVETPDLRRALRGRLRNLEAASDIANSLCDSMAGGSEHAQFTEQLRARLTRRLSSDLSNYWGQAKVVEQVVSRVNQNLLFLEQKWAWEGIPSGQLIPNGFLLYGEPGAGKTFFVTCLANELELPLVTVSREELGKAMQEAAKGEVSDMEESLGTFLESKVKEALDRKERSGARSVILFIDEMEAEFLQRDPKTGERAELARTNIMLRVIERMMGRYPEIQFFGATNHIDQVDRAALRFGRYGMHFEFTLPNKDDVRAILTGCLSQEGLRLPTSAPGSEALTHVLTLGEWMVPLAIQMAVNNAITIRRIAQKNREISVDAELLAELQNQLTLIRAMNTIHDESSHDRSSTPLTPPTN